MTDPSSTGRRERRTPEGILDGSQEGIFRVLPESILGNMRSGESEGSLLWNLIYPRAQPTISLRRLLQTRPLWGSPAEHVDDDLKPYYWGLSAEGERLPSFKESLTAVAGRGDLLEIDLLLVGRTHVVVVEAKHGAAPGTCSRYQAGRCPEIHGTSAGPCLYWEGDPAPFASTLSFGPRPIAGGDRPPCADHYQLARCLLLARELAGRLGLIPHLWLVIPSARWREVQPLWLDFAERVTEETDWRRLRVLPWEAIRDLDRSNGGAVGSMR
jgi:hypothetical protein